MRARLRLLEHPQIEGLNPTKQEPTRVRIDHAAHEFPGSSDLANGRAGPDTSAAHHVAVAAQRLRCRMQNDGYAEGIGFFSEGLANVLSTSSGTLRESSSPQRRLQCRRTSATDCPGESRDLPLLTVATLLRVLSVPDAANPPRWRF
jgi:hypothetical protein